MKSTIDLHAHTTASDGELTVEQLVDLAAQNGVKTLAITDHETVESCEAAIAHGRMKGVEIIPGIEISCDEKEHGFAEVHVVGLFIDHKSPAVHAFCENVRLERIAQKKKIIEKLQRLGFNITFDEVAAIATYSFGRPHIAQILVQKYPEEFPDVRSVFDRYIGAGKPAYVERSDRIRVKEAIDLIRGARGITVLAHPGVYKKEDAAQLISFFAASGGDGVETYYSYDLVNGLTQEGSDGLNAYFRARASEHGLLQSGGSDYHGPKVRGTVTVGSTHVPDALLKKMKAFVGKK